MSTAGQRQSVIRVLLRRLAEMGGSTGVWQELVGLCPRRGRRAPCGGRSRTLGPHPDAPRGLVILPVSAMEHIGEVARQVRDALGVELAVIDPAADTMEWLDGPPQPLGRRLGVWYSSLTRTKSCACTARTYSPDFARRWPAHSVTRHSGGASPDAKYVEKMMSRPTDQHWQYSVRSSGSY